MVGESYLSTQVGLAVLAALVVGGVAVGATKLLGKKPLLVKRATGGNGHATERVETKPAAAAERRPTALYQKDRIVAGVVNAEVDEVAQVVRFEELHNSDDLFLPEEAEFQKYKILIKTIADATKIDRNALHKGRILRGVTAKILGYREQ